MTGVQKITILGTVGKSEGNELPLKGAGALEGVRGLLIWDGLRVELLPLLIKKEPVGVVWAFDQDASQTPPV